MKIILQISNLNVANKIYKLTRLFINSIHDVAELSWAHICLLNTLYEKPQFKLCVNGV